MLWYHSFCSHFCSKLCKEALTEWHFFLYFIDYGDIQLALQICQSSQNPINLPALVLVNLDPPTSMELVSTVQFSSFYVHSVTKHQNHLYTGHDNGTIMRAHEPVNTSSLSQLVNVGGWVSSIQVYNNELYVLSRSTNKVYVYDLAGRLKRSWSHNGNSGYFNKLRVVNEKVVVPDGASQSLTVYTLQGRLMKQVKVPGMTSDWKALAVCGDNSVILTDYSANSVLRVNIDSGEVMWTSKHVTNPQGVVCYKDRYVLITNYNSETKICILDIDTGNYLVISRFFGDCLSFNIVENLRVANRSQSHLPRHS